MEPEQPPPGRRRPGRPLSFDRGAALHQAMLVFWRHGYESTSLADLTLAMGISAPSLYSTFGDKKRLFLASMNLYAGDADALQARIDAAPTALHAARDMLAAAAAGFTGDTTPKGCLLASAAASTSAAAADVQEAVAAIRGRIAGQLRARIERDVAARTLPPGTDAAPWANLVVAVIQGMSVLARDGAPRPTLLALAEAAVAGWPPALDGSEAG